MCVLPQEEMRTVVERIIVVENESVWSVRKKPEEEDNFFCSPFPMDIWTVRLSRFISLLVKKGEL